VPYNQRTLADIAGEIAALSDPSLRYWNTSEIYAAIREAMYEWSGVTSYWRERGAFTINPPTSTSPPTYFYNLATVLPVIRTRVRTFDSIIKEIQAHLCEPESGYVGSNMSGQFTIGEIVAAVIRARNRFVLDAELPLTIAPALPVSAPPADRLPLPPTTALVHAAYWVDSNGAHYPLHRSDPTAMDASNPIWTLTPDRPVAFSQGETRPIELQLYPPPISNGELEMLSVDTRSLTIPDITATTLLGIPDDFAHAVKYSAMADILSLDGESSSPLVSTYCQFRYSSVVRAARAHRSVLRVQVNNKPVGLVPLQSLDSIQSGWHSSRGTPTIAATVYDIITFHKLPSATFGVTCDVARSAPVPASGIDFIQLGLEDIAGIVNYAQHYLSIKLGGAEFRQTFPMYDEFQRSAVKRNDILRAQSRYLTTLFEQSRWEQAKRPDSIGDSSGIPKQEMLAR